MNQKKILGETQEELTLCILWALVIRSWEPGLICFKEINRVIHLPKYCDPQITAAMIKRQGYALLLGQVFRSIFYS